MNCLFHDSLFFGYLAIGTQKSFSKAKAKPLYWSIYLPHRFMSIRKAPSAKYTALTAMCASTVTQMVVVPCETIKIQLQVRIPVLLGM